MTNTIVVGAGLAGLYYALCNYQTSKITILEKSNRIGGRIGQYNFHGVDVVYGAGIGRYNKDILLKKLLKVLGIEYKVYTTKISYILPQVVNILDTLEHLKTFYNPHLRSTTTFREFLLQYMTRDDAYNWICSSGYTDYLDADVYDTLYDYGFDDNVGGYQAMNIPWNMLLDKIKTFLLDRGVNIVLGVNVKSINKKRKIIVDTNRRNYICDKIVLAIPSPEIKRLINPLTPTTHSGTKVSDIYDQVAIQPFCRLYIKIDPSSSSEFVKNIENFTFVEPPLQKIIPWKDKGVYMISYSDNKSAEYVKDLSTKDLEELVYQTTKYRIKILDKLVFYFEVGTHYYKPLDVKFFNRSDFLRLAQNPYPDIYVVGEGFSQSQGWCEGALESVKNLSKIIP